MDLRDVHGASIDVCAACGALWIDWFDGNLREMVRAAGRVSAGASDSASGSKSCPRCQRALSAERFGKVGASILRCAECAGALVPRGSIDDILAEEPPAVEERAAVSPLTRLMAIRRQLVGGSEGAA
jgi:Zn-finger nucleic acid-binding protein